MSDLSMIAAVLVWAAVPLLVGLLLGLDRLLTPGCRDARVRP